MKLYTSRSIIFKSLIAALIVLFVKNFIFKQLSINGQELHDLIELSDITIVFTGAFFVFGLLLAATMSDFKESEKIPGEIASNLEAIKDWIYLAFRAPRTGSSDLCKEDFYRILTEPQNSLAMQYSELLKTEGITLEFTKDGLEALADIAFEVNSSTQNIGARRLHTVMERVVEEISFHGSDLDEKTQKIDSAYVKNRLKDVLQREDLARFIL